MTDNLSPQMRVLSDLIEYQREYKEQTQDYAPGNRYWADKFMTIVGRAKQALTTKDEPHEIDKCECPDCRNKVTEAVNKTNTVEDECFCTHVNYSSKEYVCSKCLTTEDEPEPQLPYQKTYKRPEPKTLPPTQRPTTEDEPSFEELAKEKARLQREIVKLKVLTVEDESKFDTLDDVFGDLPPRTDWQELRMAFTVWRCNLKGKIRRWLQQEDE